MSEGPPDRLLQYQGPAPPRKPRLIELGAAFVAGWLLGAFVADGEITSRAMIQSAEWEAARRFVLGRSVALAVIFGLASHLLLRRRNHIAIAAAAGLAAPLVALWWYYGT